MDDKPLPRPVATRLTLRFSEITGGGGPRRVLRGHEVHPRVEPARRVLLFALGAVMLLRPEWPMFA